MVLIRLGKDKNERIGSFTNYIVSNLVCKRIESNNFSPVYFREGGEPLAMQSREDNDRTFPSSPGDCVLR